ncbi:hypothetical protein ACNJED_21140, partial [Mycobacterium tuberculosis]
MPPSVIPAQTGIQGCDVLAASPANRRSDTMDPGVRRDDERNAPPQFVIPAKAGIQTRYLLSSRPTVSRHHPARAKKRARDYCAADTFTAT